MQARSFEQVVWADCKTSDISYRFLKNQDKTTLNAKGMNYYQLLWLVVLIDLTFSAV